MTHRIVILGAGYAGFGAARRAARVLRDADVQLVSRAGFVERVRMHQLAAGQDVRQWPLPGRTATVAGIDLSNRTVHLDDGELRYDTLVYALGSSADLDSVPGVREHAFAVATPDQALLLRDNLPRADTVAVVGGGLTGIETATELAEAHPGLRVSLVSDSPVGGWLSAPARKHLRKAFARLGVSLWEGQRIAKVGPAGVLLADGRELSADLVVWAAGFRVPPIAAESGLTVDSHGRIVVDSHLRSVSNPEVRAIGDAAAAPTPGGTETRMSCQTALPMGRYVAGDLARTLSGRPSKPIRIRYVWQNISLGRHDGITQFTHPDDTPINAVLTGRLSAWFKEFITRGAAWQASR